MILGRELFDAARLRIDIDGRRIGEVDRDSTPPGVALDLTEEHGVTTLPVIVEGEEPVRATFDLGNGAQVLVSQAFAVRRGFFADGREVSHESGGGLGGAADRAVIVLKSLDLAGHRFENVEAAVDPQNTASDVNIGVSLLRSFILTTDFSRHRVWLLERKGRAAGKRIRRAA
ncbi:MAG: aspartyl protease family protein [Steroidobacteraceae bacterium]